MRKVAAVALSGALLLLAGCSAQSDQAVAHARCLESVKAQLPDVAEEINTSKIETANMTDAMRELAENPLKPDPDEAVLYTTAGTVWYKFGDQERSATVLCNAEMLDGEPVRPIEATVSNN